MTANEKTLHILEYKVSFKFLMLQL